MGVLDTHRQGGGLLSPARPSFLHPFGQNNLGLPGMSSWGRDGGDTRTPVPKGTAEWVGLTAETLAPEMLGT